MTDIALINVRLAAHVKENGKWRDPGDILTVTPEEAAYLRKNGALAEGSVELSELASGMPGFEEAVAQTSKALADAAVEAAVEAALADTGKALADAEDALAVQIARAVEAEAQRDLLQDRVTELQAQVEAAAADSDPDAGKAAAKPSSKKGSATKG